MIYLDACVLIYAHEGSPACAQRILEKMDAQADARLAVSPLVKLECLVGPMRSGNLVLQRGYEAALARLLLLDMSEDVYLQAAELRARFGLKTPDALHLACAAPRLHGTVDQRWAIGESQPWTGRQRPGIGAGRRGLFWVRASQPESKGDAVNCNLPLKGK